VRLNEHLEHDCGLTVFQHACMLGCEGIVSKPRYRCGRTSDWLKFKNPEAPAIRREGKSIGDDNQRKRWDEASSHLARRLHEQGLGRRAGDRPDAASHP
jgi:hypothetical protein